jgi:hypothetical protein
VSRRGDDQLDCSPNGDWLLGAIMKLKGKCEDIVHRVSFATIFPSDFWRLGFFDLKWKRAEVCGRLPKDLVDYWVDLSLRGRKSDPKKGQCDPQLSVGSSKKPCKRKKSSPAEVGMS